MTELLTIFGVVYILAGLFFAAMLGGLRKCDEPKDDIRREGETGTQALCTLGAFAVIWLPWMVYDMLKDAWLWIRGIDLSWFWETP